MVAELRLWNQGRSEKEWTLEREQLVVRSKLFPPPLVHGELDKWDDWSWQLKAICRTVQATGQDADGRD